MSIISEKHLRAEHTRWQVLKSVFLEAGPLPFPFKLSPPEAYSMQLPGS